MAVAQPIAFQQTADCLTAAYGTKWNGNASATNGSLFAAQPIPIDTMNMTPRHSSGGLGFGQPGDPSFTLTKGHSHAVAQPIGWDEELNASTEQSGTLLRGGQGGRHDGVMTSTMQVRRLTPVECERLQGFPDNYTNIPWRKKPEAPDGPRYKALGNSWAVPVVRWIGERIAKAT
jgi:DNA (cytosine-5)-methyltransferase 1